MKILLFTLSLMISVVSHAQVSKDFLMGKENITTSSAWTKHNGMYIQRATLEAFKEMQSAALKSNIKIDIVSAYRGFSRQKGIWERKWRSAERAHLSPKERALHILKYSSMPGTSRHHWGTDIDLNSVSPNYFKSGAGLKLYNWLKENAHTYGFHQPYTPGRDKGYADEPWHWSFSRESNLYHDQYLKVISNSDINGFLGSDISDDINVVDGWVNLNK